MSGSPFIPQGNTLRQAWAEYLISLPNRIGSPYEYFGTLTFEDYADIPTRHQVDILRKRFLYLGGEINSVVYGKRWMRRGEGVWGVYAIEGVPDYPHIHFLMGGAGLRAGIRRLEIMDMAETLWKGFNRVSDCKGEAAVRYITKYVNKGGTVDVWAGAKVRDKLKS